nr:NADH dehydrogenase (ubiquinone) Fe-S protein 5 [Kwoniella mangroviensis CBS 8507]OCF69735.1 NADH dehydrogenase (ubiquinone) Fe-S protein 5 [Kwoniella mangroviensis CBS 8507]
MESLQWIGRTRCFPLWQEFSKCYASAEKPVDCVAQKDDYMECLHHTKEKESISANIHDVSIALNLKSRSSHNSTLSLPGLTLQIARAKEIKSHFVQTQISQSSDARKAAEKAATGVIVSLGLVKEEEGQ